MAITRSKKTEILDLLEKKVFVQDSVVLLTTKDSKEKLNAENNFKFRKEAREKGLIIKIVKNSFLKKMFPNLGKIEGQTYLAYLEKTEKTDEVIVPKNIIKIVQDNFSDYFGILGSVIKKDIYDTQKTIALSKTLTKKESLAKIAGLLKTITAKVAISIKEIPSQVARATNQVAKKKSA